MQRFEYKQNANTERGLFHQYWETTNFFTELFVFLALLA